MQTKYVFAIRRRDWLEWLVVEWVENGRNDLNSVRHYWSSASPYESLTFEWPSSTLVVNAQRLATTEQSDVTSWTRSTLPWAALMAPAPDFSLGFGPLGRLHPLNIFLWRSERRSSTLSLRRSIKSQTLVYSVNWVKSGLHTYTTIRSRAIRIPWRLELNPKVGIYPHKAWNPLTV